MLAAELSRAFADLLCEAEDELPPRHAKLFADCLDVVRAWLAGHAPTGWSRDRLADASAREAVVNALLPALRLSDDKVSRTGIPSDPDRPFVSASTWDAFGTRLEHVVDLQRSELNKAACHSELEVGIARQLDRSGAVTAITRNHGPQRVEIPYRFQGSARRYVPDSFLRPAKPTVLHALPRPPSSPDAASRQRPAPRAFRTLATDTASPPHTPRRPW